MAKRTISFTVTEMEYEELQAYAFVRGHRVQHPVNAFCKYAVFSTMAKTPLSEAQISKYKETHGIGPVDATTGVLGTSDGELGGGHESKN